MSETFQASKRCVVFAKGSGFPYAVGAGREKTLLMGKLLGACGFDVYVLSGIFYASQDAQELRRSGEYDTLRFYSPSAFLKPDSLLKKIRFYSRTMLNAVKFFAGLRKRYKELYIIYEYNQFPFLLLYKTVSLIYRIPLILNIEEWYLAFSMETTVRALNSYVCCSIAPRMSHGCICITEFLCSKIRDTSKKARIFKLPAIADFSTIAGVSSSASHSGDDRTTFVYCAGTGYREVIDLVLGAFVRLIEDYEPKCSMVLILYGNIGDVRKLEEEYSRYGNCISFLTDLPYSELIMHYKSASALLIPLRPTVQDEARFPHKIAEYTASARPIVTTWHGDIKMYFRDRENALIMKDYSEESLMEAMKFVIRHPEEASLIGQRGYMLGREVFDFKNYSDSLGSFIGSFAKDHAGTEVRK